MVKRIKRNWTPPKDLKWYFTPTSDKAAEIGKAAIKNYNLPILQLMYNGDPYDPLRCLITGEPGWKIVNDFCTNKPKVRFNIDFNHIRQYQDGRRAAGRSLDRGEYAASGAFRGFRLDENLHYLTEFMTIIPICQEYHRYISQDSAINNISLTTFKKKHWPWILKSKSNFNYFCNRYELDFKYSWFIDHLSDISHPSIYVRTYWNKKK